MKITKKDKGEQIKKPFYKRRWFFVLIAVVIVSAIFGGNDKDDEEVEVSNKSKVENVENEKPKEDKPKKENITLASLYPQDIHDNFTFKVNMDVAAIYFIEEYEKQKVKKITDKTIATYSSDPVHDQAGNSFPYSFLLTGRYEEKGTGSMKDFVITLGFKDDESLEKGLASCIQYINDDTGYYLNAMNPDDDVILKLMESINN